MKSWWLDGRHPGKFCSSKICPGSRKEKCQETFFVTNKNWIPAFAGMTKG